VTDPAVLMAPPVLVVDDDVAVRGLIVFALRDAGFEVIEVDSAEAALETIEKHSVSVIVSDVGLPGMSGMDMVRALRRRPESATLPVILMTGSGDSFSLVAGLGAGADDFLVKPVEITELVARVRAHLRTQAAWSDILQRELAVRAGVVAALASLTLSSVPEETADAIVRELATRTEADFVSVSQVSLEGGLHELATYNPRTGVRRGGDRFADDLAAYLLGRARSGPWVEQIRASRPEQPTSSLRNANVDVLASAPLFARNQLVGLLSIGAVADASRSSRSQQAKLLAAAIDYASVLSAIAGPSLAGRQELSVERARLREVLETRAFHTVFQSIVDVESLAVVGFEALTRFDDGTRPDVRFAEAGLVGMGSDFELDAIRMALSHSGGLPEGAFISVNISPESVISCADDLAQILAATDRLVVIELTEHVMIEDYAELRAVLQRLGAGVQVAVDDAGAGFASMRHILELQPDFAKLDMSLVRGIDGDNLRQALAAGLNYYAMRTGCRLIAEGIETQAEADTLHSLGIELGQGYLYSRPEPLAADDPA
jgi:EAL domain-containing protein (putative c-di-GMP-specific phosphodiesterase class I)/DNA-binding response OmpR family regulator